MAGAVETTETKTTNEHRHRAMPLRYKDKLLVYSVCVEADADHLVDVIDCPRDVSVMRNSGTMQ